jgi:hypothetical protein
VDFNEERKDWKRNGILTAKQYRKSLQRNPQSLNDFKHSCIRLQSANKLHGMTFSECEYRRAQFGNSMREIRINATAAQVPYLSGAILNGDRGELSQDSTKRAVYGFYNTWLSPVQGTLPSEWSEVFPNLEIM